MPPTKEVLLGCIPIVQPSLGGRHMASLGAGWMIELQPPRGALATMAGLVPFTLRHKQI